MSGDLFILDPNTNKPMSLDEYYQQLQEAGGGISEGSVSIDEAKALLKNSSCNILTPLNLLL